MQPKTDTEYKAILSDVIKKQIVVLGPDITLSKARSVKGLIVDDDGTVSQIMGDPQEVIKNLTEQFVELSEIIVKKTMEPLLTPPPAENAPSTTPEVPAPASTLPLPPLPTTTPVSQAVSIDAQAKDPKPLMDTPKTDISSVMPSQADTHMPMETKPAPAPIDSLQPKAPEPVKDTPTPSTPTTAGQTEINPDHVQEELNKLTKQV